MMTWSQTDRGNVTQSVGVYSKPTKLHPVIKEPAVIVQWGAVGAATIDIPDMLGKTTCSSTYHATNHAVPFK